MEKVASLLERISKHEAWEIAKPWVERAAIKAGVKSLYDVPEYFREKLELKGLKIGKKEFGGGLSGATADLLEKNKTSLKDDGGGRKDLYAELTKLEQSGLSDSEEYKEIEKKLDETRSTEVKDAIAKVNKKLSLTKEGGVKHSEARKEMARILREQRKAKAVNREALKKEVNTALDDYTTQKVDGVTAAREVLRSALTVTGTRQFMVLGNAALDGASFVKQAAQVARREGQDLNAGFLAKQFSEAAKERWSELTGGDGEEEGGLVGTAASAISKLDGVAAKYGINTGAMRDVSHFVAPIAAKAASRFKSVTPKTSQSTTASPASRKDERQQQKSTPDELEQVSGEAPTSTPFKSAYAYDQPGRTGRSTTDQKFADSYSQRASIQPSSSGISRTRNVKVDKRNPHQRRDNQGRVVEGKRKSANASNQVVATTPKKSNVVNLDDYREQQAEREAVVTGTRAKAEAGPMPMRQPVSPRTRAVQTKTLQQKKLKLKSKAKPGTRRKAKAVSALVRIIAAASYPFQLFFGILNIFFLGLTALYLEAKDYFASGEEGGLFDIIVGGFFSVVGSVIDFLADVGEAAGLSFDIVTPDEIFVGIHLLIFVYGLALLMTAGLLYKGAGLEPLSGPGSSFKTSAFLLCLIGYSIPILNLVPWIYLWTSAVLIKPK